MIIAVDFDGTIVTHEYPKIGKEIPFAIATLKQIQTEFPHRLVLWTVREGEYLEEAVEFCKKRGLEFYAVNANYPEEKPHDNEPRKLKADLFIDDRNLGGLPDWGVIYQMIKSKKYSDFDALFKHYSGRDSQQSTKKEGFFKRIFR